MSNSGAGRGSAGRLQAAFFPESGGKVAIRSGRYGHYVTLSR
ncbi:topoisomerase C-terminal repeat-containing protein [Novosphingobium pentaromativorans]